MHAKDIITGREGICATDRGVHRQISREVHRKVHRKVHVVGIGGAGMSAIARVLRGWGLEVHGSDRRSSPITEALMGEGIPVEIGHRAESVGDADLVLASSAVPEENVELMTARRRGIRVTRRPEFLSTLTAGYDVIAVAGAHGKTTVTGMITLVLREAGLDPTYIVGGVLANLGTNGGAGEGRHFVIEADEYQKTFLALRPNIAVVTNVEFDHPDCFPDIGFVRLAFGEFVDNIEPEGLLVACANDEIAHAIAASYHASGGRVALYGRAMDPGDLASDWTWQASDLRSDPGGGVSFTAMRGGEEMGQVHLRVPGEFNVLNALAALSVAAELDIEWACAQRALESFAGTARRFEVLGEVGGVTVIDDYAHHPTQIQGVLRAARARYDNRRLVAVWEPHTFSRVRALREAFMHAFDEADQVVIMPIYPAREIDDGSLTAHDLAPDVAHPRVWSAESLEDAVTYLAATVQAGDVVMMMGAGNEYLAGRKLLERLARDA
ncbi:MAG: UDP-N-acetylmuramate--L-alanine ligase [Anaerolineae bacterium]